ncbi:hypothetical protein POM88_029006 [Heracleum sosnowskyi]|uniref:Trehalose-6-phosphate synthase n=1 Tax=Heracleum sosnowskyi TaxID=360622 RepID=A0AAD8MI41_9APIA|nr:hypothetical protein POM88_029006 [Heracleum sosnowskyi]
MLCILYISVILLVVANRLPVSAIRRGEESWSLEISAGGLVSSLLGFKEFEARWIGWAGMNVPDEAGQKALTKALVKKRCIPIFLDEELVHQYYNGYYNNILWSLFHYLGLPQEDRLATTRSFQSQFAAYKKANQMFAAVVNEHYEEGDVVWCHDYHLMTLPSRSELLHAVLAADLVGFVSTFWKHALPPGYILKSQMKALLEEDVEKISKDIENQRAKVITSTPMTPELFLEWKKMEARDVVEMA